MCELCQCRPDVQVECLGREIVVLRIGDEDGGVGVLGIWYTTAEYPSRIIGTVEGGKGSRGVGFGFGRKERVADCFLCFRDRGGISDWRTIIYCF